ncbi:MAG TPA: hypothetical protein VFN55_07035 [Solirubrobacteraceae bacterium]|nr:hypothetical protein [Solirubrobacteraceae bacterium]
MDRTGHSVLAEWTPSDAPATAAAEQTLAAELQDGYIAVLAQGPGRAEQIRTLPCDQDALVILRRPIAGG